MGGLQKCLQERCIPGPFICIDELLVPFRGRCSVLQYLPSKPDRYGLKIFWAADAESNFPLVAEPCLGRPLGQERQVNLGRNTTIKLATPFFKTGRNVTTGNFFTDKANTLLSNGLTFVGTVRTNKRFLPEAFKVKKGQQLHESSFVFQEKLTLVNYQSKPDKNVVVMSSMHHDKRIDPLAYKRKPDIVRFYNATKGAVDAMDKMAYAFAAKRVTKRWPMVLFFNVTDLSTIAARVAWMKKFPDHNPAIKDSRQQFIITIAEDLCLEQIQRRLQLKTLAKPLRLTMELFVQHIQQKTTCEGRTGGRRKRLAATSRPAAASGAKRSAASTRKSSGTISRKSATSQSPNNQRNPQGRCCFCHWKDDRKTTCSCVSCRNWVCREHAAHVCPDCTSLLQTEVTIVYRHNDELPRAMPPTPSSH